MVDRDTFEWLLEQTYGDRDHYLKAGSMASDYGDELQEFAGREAAQCSSIAKLTKSAGMHGAAVKWQQLADRFLAAGNL